MMQLPIDFLVLRAIIRYHIMIPLSPFTLLVVVPRQIFANMACMILPMILLLWLVLIITTILVTKAIVDLYELAITYIILFRTLFLTNYDQFKWS
jgi:hypothetical protein